MKRFLHILCFSILYVILWTGTSYAGPVQPTLSIAKAFGAASIPLNGTTTLTFTITNPVSAITQTQVAFTDTLPAGLVVATPNGLTNTCNGTPTATAGSTSISLTGGIMLHTTTCTVVVNVTGTASGNYTNTSGTVSSTDGGTGNSATANLTVTVSEVELNSATRRGKIKLETNHPNECEFINIGGVAPVSLTPKTAPPLTRTLTEGDLPEQDPSADYPFGLVEFNLSCPGLKNGGSGLEAAVNGVHMTVDVYMTFEDAGNMEGQIFKKYGPTPGNEDWHWYDFSWNGETGVVDITGNRITLRYVDTLRGDDNRIEDFAIFDQIGPANGQHAVPTMTEWGMLIFLVLAGTASIYYLRRQGRAKS